MKINKKLTAVSLSCAILLSSCASLSSSENSSASTDTSTVSQNSATTTANTSQGSYEEEDLSTSYDESSATKITLSDQTTVSGDGATADGQDVTITSGGTYVLKGNLSDGQVTIKAGKDEKVRLILNGVTITNKSGPAIYVEQAEKVITTLVSDTTNTLTDGSDYDLASGETEPDAVFFSKEDLVINGDGSLNVTGNYNNGIRSKDDLILISGKITVKAKNNALKGKDSVQIKDGTYKLTTTAGDGIQSNNAKDSDKGYVIIDGGTFTINSGRDGIQAETDVTLQNASFTINSGMDSEVSESESYKGIKAGNSLTVNSGTFKINSADDTLHSNNNLTIKDGKFTLSSGDDGIHADNNLKINGGTINITKSYEGIEASKIYFNDGDITVKASDDGVNAGGGSDTTDTDGQFGADSFDGGPGGGAQADDSKAVYIKGGTLAISAEGDGLDSNGNIKMTGGTVTVDGPTNGGNGALDYNGSFKLTGGTLIAAGSTGMAMNVSDTSTQASVAITFDEEQAAGTVVSLQDSSGNVIATYQPGKKFQHIVISSAKLKKGETYSLVTGSKVDGDDENGYYGTASIINGVETGELKLTDTVSNLTESGEEAQSDNNGGPGGDGGPGDNGGDGGR